MLDAKDEIKSKLDIVDVLSEYITLKQAGTSFRALCPFHNEKTPSFIISQEKQIWHCFGCGEGGDIFSFVMKMENVEFPEAMRILAAKAGVELKRQDPKLISQKTKLLDINEAAAGFFRQELKSPRGQTALEYLRDRGLTEETMAKFQIGYAPDSWDSLLNFLKAKGFKEQDIELAGLITKKQATSSYYDRFRDRIMFPISDTHGNIVGFTGRLLKEDPAHPAGKYVNTPETPVYSKGHLLYALDKAKTEIKKKNLAVLVEGNMDAIASHQAGIANVVASSGTALTPEQAALLKRYSANLAISFDEDSAGQEATKRGINVALAQGLNIRIIEVPFGKDPDDCIKKDPALWTKSIESSKSIMEYYFGRVFAKLDLSKIENRKKARDVLLPAIGKLPDRLEQDFWIKKLAEKIEADEEILREEMRKKAAAGKSKFPGKAAASGGAGKPKESSGGGSAVLSERLAALVLKFPENLKYLAEKFEPEILTPSKSRQLAELLINYYNNKTKQSPENGFDYGGFLRHLAETDKALLDFTDFLCLLAEKEFSGMDSDEIEAEMKDILKRLEKNRNFELSKEYEKELQIAEKENRQEDAERLAKQFFELTQKLDKIDKT